MQEFCYTEPHIVNPYLTVLFDKGTDPVGVAMFKQFFDHFIYQMFLLILHTTFLLLESNPAGID